MSSRPYVMMGYPKDTLALAEQRLQSMTDIGFTPFAMLWKPENVAGEKRAPGPEWRPFVREWSRAAIIHGNHDGHSLPGERAA